MHGWRTIQPSSPQGLCQTRRVDPFTTHTGKIAVMNEDHVDTDRIIPARFLSRVSRSGYGELLFVDVRSDDFVLDRPEAEGATVLVVGTNFGCGSSREHAVWAIQQAGFRAVVALRMPDTEGYSDIFRQNAANCGLLLVELDPAEHAALVLAGTGAEVTIDLPAQTVRLGEREFTFDIAPTSKQALVAGLDLIGTTLRHADEIGAYERTMRAYVPGANL
jgi:3-isopropylmalate/(R)-2-methylmalate dehydratase small subunit